MGLVKVLIIDDSPTDLMIMAALLDTIGKYEVSQAASGFEALEALGEHPVDICLVDFDMPGMNGLEFVERAHLTYPGLSCVVVTGTPPVDLAGAARLSGVDAIISKSDLDPTYLDGTIRATLGTRVE